MQNISQPQIELAEIEKKRMQLLAGNWKFRMCVMLAGVMLDSSQSTDSKKGLTFGISPLPLVTNRIEQPHVYRITLFCLEVCHGLLYQKP
jgi:hypothetical protein